MQTSPLKTIRTEPAAGTIQGFSLRLLIGPEGQDLCTSEMAFVVQELMLFASKQVKLSFL